MSSIHPVTHVLWRIDPLPGKDLDTNNDTTAFAMQRHGKHASTTIELLLETVFSTRSLQRGYLEEIGATSSLPCGGGVEYLHRSRTSRRRRRKGKSRI
jgi:hypothetical protein